MPITAIKTSFGAGEVTPSLWYRVDLSKHGSGARTIRNCVVHPHGGVSNKPGSEMVAKAKFDNKRIRLIPFEFSTTQKYMIESGDEYMRLNSDGSQVLASPDAWVTATVYVVGDFVTQSSINYYCIVAHTSGVFATDLAALKWVAQDVYEFVSPYVETDQPRLRYAQSADTIFVASGVKRPKMIQRLGATEWQVINYPYTNGPFRLQNTTDANTLTSSATAVNATTTLTASVDTFNVLHEDSLFELSHYIEGQTSSISIGSSGAQTAIKCGGTWRLITHGTWTGKVAIQKSTDGGTTWTVLRTFASTADNNVNTFGDETVTDGEPFLIRSNMISYTSGTCYCDLTTDPFTQKGIVRIDTFTDAQTITGTVLKEIGATTATIDWAEGAWSDYHGWPSEVTFASDRLLWASTTSDPQTEWYTKTGDYYKFIRNTPLLDTDGITVNLPSTQLNAINGLIPLVNLVALTNSAQWRIAPTTGNLLTPTTATSEIQGYDGSNGVAPVVIGNRAIYVGASGDEIRDLGFQLQDNGFVGNHISILSKHLFFNKTVIAMAYQQAPDSIVWMAMSDGTLVTCTYLREQDVIAWTRCDTQDGLYEEVASLQASGYKEVYFAVNRGGEVYIERLKKRLESKDPRDQYFVDCGITYYDPKEIESATQADPGVFEITDHGYVSGDLVDAENIGGMTELEGVRYEVVRIDDDTFSLLDVNYGTAIDTTEFGAWTSGGTFAKCVTTITGLGHLEGKSVAVLADGNVVYNYTTPGTVESAQITIPSPSSKVIIGIPYQSDVETLNFDYESKTGTVQGRKMKISKLVLQMIDSRGGWIGADFDNMNETSAPERVTYDDPLALYTGEIAEIMNAGYQDGARVCFRQNDPLPFTIATIIPTITAGGMVAK